MSEFFFLCKSDRLNNIFDAAKQAECLKIDSARILNNIFRVRLGKVLKNINLL
jgi:hypothetical protein